MVKPNQFRLLPDSNLPIEDEVSRNIKNLADKCRQKIDPLLVEKSDLHKFRNGFYADLERVLLENYGEEFRTQINERRGSDDLS